MARDRPTWGVGPPGAALRGGSRRPGNPSVAAELTADRTHFLASSIWCALTAVVTANTSKRRLCETFMNIISLDEPLVWDWYRGDVWCGGFAVVSVFQSMIKS